MKVFELVKKFVFKHKCLYSLAKTLKNRKSGKCWIENNGYTRLKKDIQGKDNYIKIDNRCTLYDTTFRIRGNNNKIIFENNCWVGENCSFWIEGNNIEIIVGEGSTFTHTVHFCAQEDYSKIIIGKDCIFSNNIIVRTSDSHPIYDLNTNIRINSAKNVILGEHVWIAPNTKIMKGAVVGNGSIIGSDSMVSKTIPDNVLAVGHPAVVVKENIKWTREKVF